MRTYRVIDDNKANYLDYEAEAPDEAARKYMNEHYFNEVRGDEEIELIIIDPDGKEYIVDVEVDVEVSFNTVLWDK